MNRPVNKVPKKPYAAPILTIYGTVRELTRKVAIKRQRDGGRFPRYRTSIH